MQRRTFRSFTLPVIVFGLLLLACDLGTFTASKPTAVIASPPSGSQFREGEDVAIQSTSTDSAGVVRVELSVDGTVVRTDTAPGAQISYALIQVWKATPGTHTITVRAFNAANVPSDPAAISLNVLPATAAALPSPTVSLVPRTATPTLVTVPTAVTLASPTATTVAGACVNNAIFVADVTVPDGTVLAAGQPFNKIWRVRNNGTCAWGSDYQYVFIGGEAMATTTMIAVPNTAAGATADLLIAMVAPTAPGAHVGQWRMRAPNGALFGNTMNVTINVLGAAPPPAAATATTVPPPGCPGAPVIASFTASPGTITAGGSTTLSWGAVTNADSASIDQGIGGIATPGNIVVSPATTTTYTLTATGCGGTVTQQVTVTVTGAPPAGQPDLTVTALEFNPATPTPGGSFQVRITISNLGSVAVSDFVVRALRQAPGANCLTDPGTVLFDRHTSIGAGATIVYTENATISAAGSYRICARLDHVNGVAESNENNNIYQSNLTVAVAGQPDLRPHFIGLSDNTPNAGQTISANLTLRNDGTAAVSSFVVRLLQQTTSASCVPGNHPGTVLFDRTTGPLSASGSMVFSETFNFSSAGTYRLCVVLDHVNNIAESNEGNNTLQSGNITVSP
ncbi:MAG: hypothetical protein HY782_04570 [Chloroflexi bacterium]|nr:hypothetical protein [Chloroflexota bacterium]